MMLQSMLLRITKLLLASFFYVANKSFLLILSLLQRKYKGTLVVLMYHAVKPGQRTVFEKHMDDLLKTGVPVSTAHMHLLEDCQHHIAITFDDGFQGIVENALPVLRQRNLPATFFIPTGYLGKKPGWICNPQHDNTHEILLTESQLQQLPEDLITIGSHCVTHPRLAEIDPGDAMEELVNSKKTLETIIGKPVTLFSFPYGSYNETIVIFAKQAGYEKVFLNIPTFPASKTGEYIIGRMDVSLDDWGIEYRLKMAGAYQWLPLAIVVKRKLMLHMRKLTGEK